MIQKQLLENVRCIDGWDASDLEYDTFDLFLAGELFTLRDKTLYAQYRESWLLAKN